MHKNLVLGFRIYLLSETLGLGARDSMLCQIPQQGDEMSKLVIQSERGAPPQGAYSQGWRAGDFIFVTGTGPIDPITGKLVGNEIEQQTEQTIDNLTAILAAEGASLADVVKVNVHLSDTGLFARYNAVYAQRFTKPYPVRTTVGSDLGHTPGMLIEIDCTAYMPEKQRPRTSARAGRRTKKKARRGRHG